jgi:uncharacterized protein
MRKINAILFCSALLMTNMGFAQEFEEVKKPNDPNGNGKPNNVKEFEADCGSDLEFDEDADLVFHVKSGKPFSGLCRSYFEDGSLEREVRFEDGKEDGESVTLYQPNAEGKQIMMVRVNHKMGVPEGTWDFFYPSGRKAWTENYVNGVKHGGCNYFDEEGKPKKEELYKNGLKDGVCKEYYEGGKIRSEISYKDGVMDGQYKTYYKNGQISYEGKYTAGKENGEVVTYYEKGQMSSQAFFKNGVMDGEFRTWFDDSHEKIIVKYIMGKKEGEAKEFYKDGQIKKTEKWVGGKLMEIEAYDEYGNKIDPDELKK